MQTRSGRGSAWPRPLGSQDRNDRQGCIPSNLLNRLLLCKGLVAMLENELVSAYRLYIACLNDRDLDQLGNFVDDDVEYNGRRIGLAGYRAMLEGNYRDIPDLRFAVQMV